MIRNLLLALLLITAPFAVAEERPLRFPHLVRWQPRFDGVDYAELVLTSPRRMRGHMLRVNLRAPGVEVIATSGNGDRPGETDGLRTSTFLARAKCHAAINAAPFSPVRSVENRSQEVSGLLIHEGSQISASDGHMPALLFKRDGAASIEVPPFELDGVQEAVAGFSVVLRDGRVTSQGEDLHPRTAAGVSRDGRVLFLLVVDGRQSGFSEGASTRDIALWLKFLGADDGINLDGGGTTTMVLAGPDGKGKIVNRPIHAGVPGLERVSGCHLGIRSRALGSTGAPDLIAFNGVVLTMDEANRNAQGFAVKDGRFTAVGSSDRMRALARDGTERLDLGGRTVTPGFIDAHMHPRPIYPFESPHHRVDLGPHAVRTLDELVAALAKKAAITPKGQWVLGSRYEDTKLGRHPTREDLDRASTEHPIRIGHSSGHVSVVNSWVLRRARITKATKDPPGGAFDRDTRGEPNGVCREGPAATRASRGAPRLPEPTSQERLDGLRLCFQRFLSKGITSVADAGVDPSKYRLYESARDAGLPVRVYAMFRERHLSYLEERGLRTGHGDDRLRLGSIKLFHGNSLSGRTCWLYEPYAGRPDYFGIPPKRSQEELDRLILRIHEAGFQAAVHSNGDREIDMVLDAFEKALAKAPRENHRHRIEHASVVNASILARVKKLGIVLALHSYVHEHGDKMEAYGAKRWPWMHTNRSALELGIPVAGNSDFGVSAADPLLRIQSMVTRRSAEGKVYGAEQRVTVEQALRIWTVGSAYACFAENRKGSIEPEKLADFVILSDDPRHVAAERLKDVKVERTYIGGQVAYP